MYAIVSTCIIVIARALTLRSPSHCMSLTEHEVAPLRAASIAWPCLAITHILQDRWARVKRGTKNVFAVFEHCTNAGTSICLPVNFVEEIDARATQDNRHHRRNNQNEKGVLAKDAGLVRYDLNGLRQQSHTSVNERDLQTKPYVCILCGQ